MSRLIRFRFLLFTSFSLLFITVPAVAQSEPLVAARSVWKYLADGSDQKTAWKEVWFDDSSWPSGQAELGFGDGDETTVIPAVPVRNTTYFRQEFTVDDPSATSNLTLRLVRDDGAIVYLNGVEVWRDNMPAGPVGYRGAAASNVADADEAAWHQTVIPRGLLVRGRNVVAVEVHQAYASSSDLSFALEMLGSSGVPTPALRRPPYLQQSTPESIVVRWRTDVPTISRVRYGKSPSDLTTVVDDPAVTTEHVVTLRDLTPATRYWYSVETSVARVGGGTAEYFFVTSPIVGTSVPTRIWAIGDAGTGQADARAVRDAYYTYPGSRETNLWLMLGDNAYDNGLDGEYQRGVFDVYSELLRHSVVWPAIGNHDTAQATVVPPGIPYDVAFTLPQHGEAGGVPSGTERYYSFDYGNIHFISLDSMTSSRAATGAMATWLRADLAATRQPWIIAYWHHPPYSHGTHNSDVETELVEMRQNLVPILEEGGVDLVLCGHSHGYERSYFLYGHYGVSSSFTSSMKLDPGNGRSDGTGAYRKGTTASRDYRGTVYVVAGTAAFIRPASLDHPAMLVNASQLGSLVVDVNGSRLDLAFLRPDGTTGDHFTMQKTMPGDPPSAPSSVRVAGVTPRSAEVSWTDTSSTETGFRIERCAGAGCTNFVTITQTPANDTRYVDTGLDPTTLYRYRVYAANASGQSSPSGVADVTTYGGRRRATAH